MSIHLSFKNRKSNRNKIKAHTHKNYGYDKNLFPKFHCYFRGPKLIDPNEMKYLICGFTVSSQRTLNAPLVELLFRYGFQVTLFLCDLWTPIHIDHTSYDITPRLVQPYVFCNELN